MQGRLVEAGSAPPAWHGGRGLTTRTVCCPSCTLLRCLQASVSFFFKGGRRRVDRAGVCTVKCAPYVASGVYYASGLERKRCRAFEEGETCTYDMEVVLLVAGYGCGLWARWGGTVRAAASGVIHVWVG